MDGWMEVDAVESIDRVEAWLIGMECSVLSGCR